MLTRAICSGRFWVVYGYTQPSYVPLLMTGACIRASEEDKGKESTLLVLCCHLWHVRFSFASQFYLSLRMTIAL